MVINRNNAQPHLQLPVRPEVDAAVNAALCTTYHYFPLSSQNPRERITHLQRPESRQVHAAGNAAEGFLLRMPLQWQKKSARSLTCSSLNGLR
jgi:hypothetical protein